jgi:hypothetical protein
MTAITDPFDFMLNYAPVTTTDHWALVGRPLPWDYEAVTYRNLYSGEVVTVTKDSTVDGALRRLWEMHFGQRRENNEPNT